MHMETLVSAQWVAEHLDDPGLRIIDATVQVRKMLGIPTVRAGRREWRREHIPGSVFADLFHLSDPARPKRTMTMPSPEHFASAVGALGISNHHRVVLYDRRESMWAARLWWLLRDFGHQDAAILDGGWAAWQQASLPTCSRPCAYPPATFDPAPRAGLLVGKDEAIAAIDDPDVCLVNALGRRQFRGEVNEYGRRGHIPGSLNLTAWEILDRETKRYRPLEELRAKAGSILDAPRVIAYCGGGAAAASVAHALIRLGHPDVAVYDGGLMEWCADRTLPLQTGGAP